MTRTVMLAGVGPGLGAAIARRFAAEGCHVALLARTESFLTDLAADLDETAGSGLAVPTDLTDERAVRGAFETVRDALGSVDVLVYNASDAAWRGVDDLTVAEFDGALATGPRGAFLCAREAVPDLRAGGGEGGDDPPEPSGGGGGDDDGGALIFTGATTAVRGREGALGFSAAKFALRGMAQSLARELGPDGVRVAHVVLDGGIRPPGTDVDTPETYLDPDDIAATYWHVATADPATTPFEVHLTNGPSGAIEFV